MNFGLCMALMVLFASAGHPPAVETAVDPLQMAGSLHPYRPGTTHPALSAATSFLTSTVPVSRGRYTMGECSLLSPIW